MALRRKSAPTCLTLLVLTSLLGPNLLWSCLPAPSPHSPARRTIPNRIFPRRQAMPELPVPRRLAMPTRAAPCDNTSPACAPRRLPSRPSRPDRIRAALADYPIPCSTILPALTGLRGSILHLPRRPLLPRQHESLHPSPTCQSSPPQPPSRRLPRPTRAGSASLLPDLSLHCHSRPVLADWSPLPRPCFADVSAHNRPGQPCSHRAD